MNPDILFRQGGQSVFDHPDAIDGKTFSGTVKSINTTGSGTAGGVTKFGYDLCSEGEDDMLAGMSATATITVSSADTVLTIPADALQGKGQLLLRLYL